MARPASRRFWLGVSACHFAPHALAAANTDESSDADLIALGSHGYGIWKRLLLGSVASKIIRLSPRAVLVAPIGCLATMAGTDAHLQSHAGAGAVPVA